MGNTINKEYSEAIEEIVELQFKPWQMFGYGIVSLMYFLLGIFLIIYGFGILSNEKFWWASFLTLPLGLIFILDLPIYLNHYFFEAFRTVTFNKTAKIITIECFGKMKIIDLKNDHFKAIRYMPRISVSERAPGQGLGKVVIVIGNERFSFSETVLDKSYLWLALINLSSKENIKVVNRQFNFIW